MLCYTLRFYKFKNMTLIKWLARLIGFLVCGFFMMFIIGEGVPELFRGQTGVLPIMTMVVAATVGYVIGWFREKAGGIIMIIAALTMVIYHFSIGGLDNWRGALVYGLPFLTVGALFIISDSDAK